MQRQGFSAHSTAAWAILIDRYLQVAGYVSVAAVDEEVLSDLPLQKVCAASPAVRGVVAPNGLASVQAFMTAIQSDSISPLFTSVKDTINTFERLQGTSFTTIYDQMSDTDKTACEILLLVES